MRSSPLFVLGLVVVLCYFTSDVNGSKKFKNKKTLPQKTIKNGDLKKVSSSKVPNDGRKGPTSGNMSGGNMAISPVAIPFPLAPKKENKKGQLKKDEKTNKKERRVKKPHPDGVNMQRRDADEMLASDEVVRRMRRDVDEEEFSEEEKRLRDDWLKMDEAHIEDNIPSRETASFVPPNLRYIYETDAYNELFEPQQQDEEIKSVLRSKRSTFEDVEDENDVENERTPSDADEQDLMSQNDEQSSRVIEKRDVTDYDFNDEFLTSEEEDIARDMRTRDISLEDEYGDDVMEVIEDSPGSFMEPIHHTIVTRDAPSNDGRSVRFE